MAFMRVNMDQIRQKLTDELFTLTMLEVAYTARPEPRAFPTTTYAVSLHTLCPQNQCRLYVH